MSLKTEMSRTVGSLLRQIDQYRRLPETQRDSFLYEHVTAMEPQLDEIYSALLPKLPKYGRHVSIHEMDLPTRTLNGLTRAGYTDSHEVFRDFNVLTRRGQIGAKGILRIERALRDLGYELG